MISLAIPFFHFPCCTMNVVHVLQAAGTDVDNFTSALLEGGASDDKEGLVKMAATSLYSGRYPRPLSFNRSQCQICI